jgi:hypothetical protein
MPEDKSDLTLGNELLLQLSPWTQSETLAEWSLKVAPLLNEDGCIGVPFGLGITYLDRG